MSRPTPDAVHEPLPQPEPGRRHCHVPGCTEEAAYRAPVSRDRLTDYYWFCIEHVRAYNAAWNYYAGMSEQEIERHRRQDTVWQRPSWPLGGKKRDPRRAIEEEFGRAFADIFEEGPTCGPQARRTTSEQDQALSVLDLDAEASSAEIKARYIKLVKRLHPDANGGDSEAEERLKAVNLAYATLKNGYA